MTQIKNWNPVIMYRSNNGESLTNKDHLLKIQSVE